MFKLNKSVDRDLCFLLMPFARKFEPIHRKIKELVINGHNLRCIRADDIMSAGIVIEEIWEKIQEAQVIIADTTGTNPNVFYEIGLAHAIGKDPIIISQTMDDIPFDLRHRRIIIYHPDQLNIFVTILSRTIEAVKWKPFEIIQWIQTNREDIKIGLHSPTDQMTVHRTPIESIGCVVGLPGNNLHYWVQGFVITNREYEQGSSSIDNKGFWRINEIHLGATTHKLFFRIFDESGRRFVESKKIIIYKRNDPQVTR